MRFAVESWSADYGSPIETEPEAEADTSTSSDITIERRVEDWAPITPSGNAAGTVVFIDGVQQMDARVWVSADDASSRMGVCVSYAAGTVRCDAEARVESVVVARGAFGPASLGDIDCGRGVVYGGVAVAGTSPGDLDLQVRKHREDLEVDLAHRAGETDLVVVDGHVRQRETIHGAVGFIKSHQREYLEPEQAAVVGRLAPGQRTPVFLLETPWSRFSWYLKLPGGQGHPWAGVVRCEASSSLRTTEAVEFADFVSSTLPRFASQQYKDPRAPQNLYPVAGLERELRRRLGDRALLLRGLQRASSLS